MVVEVFLLPPTPSQTTSTYQEKSVIKNVLRYPTKIKINYCFLEKKCQDLLLIFVKCVTIVIEIVGMVWVICYNPITSQTAV